MAVTGLTLRDKERTQVTDRPKGGRMATAEQVAQLEKLMGVISNETTRGKFKEDPNGTADEAGVKRTVKNIQGAIDYLATLEGAELRLIAGANKALFDLGLREKTTGILAKQV